jgi:hypothetical protein
MTDLSITRHDAQPAFGIQNLPHNKLPDSVTIIINARHERYTRLASHAGHASGSGAPSV